MLGLFIDTVSSTNTVLLFSEKKILAQKKWLAHQNEADKILPAIDGLLKKTKSNWQKLTHIVVVTGPGSFTSTRIGIMVANTLSVLLHIPVLGADLFELSCLRIAATQKNIFPLMFAIQSKQEDYFCTTYSTLKKRTELAILPALPVKTKVNIVTLALDGTMAPKLPLAKLEEVLPLLVKREKMIQTLVEPVYIRQPNITVRKKR